MTAASTRVRFGYQIDAYTSYDATLKGLIEANNCRSICEVGGGANPALPLAYANAAGLRYCLLDITPTELAKAPAGYDKIVADICGETIPVGGPFDLVFSKMLAEHVRDPRRFHRNVYALLRPGGRGLSFLSHAVCVAARRESPTPRAYRYCRTTTLQPRDPVKEGKFPAYYRWCRGPNQAQIRRFEDLGYDVEEYAGFFGHGYYDEISVISALHRLATRFLVRHPVPWFASVALLILRRPTLARAA